ncbi:MAG: ATP-binding protein [Ferroplasma sp.]|uniref:AAA family ATPase n=1 Tax=Ferroplasma sp. TaxID=2591003 RepID=UPI00281679A4|nr:ATP-binding protein [Ferroplasma sp.]WMT50553.1 MAG: ATP-binding protein [Ferroplasma sp.]
MLFDITPKDNIKDLYGREQETLLLKRCVTEPLTVIYGIRRTGKTSLLKSVLNSIDMPYIIIDIRELFDESGAIRENEISLKILNELRKSMGISQKLKFFITDILSKINGIEINHFKIDIDTSRKYQLNNILEIINEISQKNNSIFILAIDEAQYLKYSGKRYNNILSWAYDSLKNIHIIITGSEIGILEDFIDIENTESPLFGRMINEIKIGHFTNNMSYNFLKAGFQEAELKVNDNDINSAIEVLDGIAGWLTYYGHNRTVRKLNNYDSINSVIEYSRRLIDSEIDKLINNSKDRYIAIMEAIAAGLNSWSTIKAYVTSKTGYIPSTILNNHIIKLQKYGFIRKSESKYYIEDPLIKLKFKNKK